MLCYVLLCFAMFCPCRYGCMTPIDVSGCYRNEIWLDSTMTPSQLWAWRNGEYQRWDWELCFAMFCYVLLCFPCFIMFCYVLLWLFIFLLCFAMFFYLLLCFDMFFICCYVLLCFLSLAMFCYVLLCSSIFVMFRFDPYWGWHNPMAHLPQPWSVSSFLLFLSSHNKT